MAFHKHKSEHDPVDESNWLVSYADMMTLLCGFFIMMFAISTVDQNKFDAMKKDIAQEFGGTYKEPESEGLARFVTELVDDAGIQKETTVKFDATGVSIAFQSAVFFDTLSADVKSEGRAVLDRLIGAILDRQAQDGKQFKILVEGHTDSKPVIGGIFPSNWELSGARAARVVRLFVEKGFPPENLTAIGYADTRPEFQSRSSDGSWDEEALSKNRRVVLRVLNGDPERSPAATSTH